MESKAIALAIIQEYHRSDLGIFSVVPQFVSAVSRIEVLLDILVMLWLQLFELAPHLEDILHSCDRTNIAINVPNSHDF